ncbi:MAG: response regulator [Lysobacteraceae bacterium]|nr:MAG: response regulator [Xanthomonadaceae bacterium]
MKPTIAVIDDDEGVRTSLSSLVRSLGYEVRTYGSAPAFLHDADTAGVGCIITDLQMPQMTGEQLQAELVSSGGAPPMIFLTAFPTQATRDRVMAMGACAFLGKPVDGNAIARHLAQVFAGTSARD